MSSTTVKSRHLDAVHAYVAAFNSRDLDGLAALLADSAALSDWDREVQGKAAVIQATRHILFDGPSLTAELLGTISEEERVAADLIISVDASNVLSVVDVFTFDSEGLITQIRAYRGAALKRPGD